jgi:WD40 repeat protein
VKIWDALKGGPSLRTLTEHLAETTSVTFSPNGKWLATGSLDNTARLWDAGGTSSIRSLAEHTVWVAGVAFSPDSKLLATASWDNSVRLWEINPRQPEQVPKVASRSYGDHKDRVATVAFSPDGKKVASGGWDKTIHLWDPVTLATLRTLTGHTLWVTSVAFSPDGKQLASGSWDTTVRLWDASTGAPLRTIKELADRVSLAAFSPDGKQIAASSPDRTVRLWSPAGGAFQKASYDDYVGRLKADALAPDRGLRVSATTEGVLVLSHPTESGRMATMRTLEGKDSGYVLAADSHIDFQGAEPCAARLLPICRIGAVSLPFEFCEERFYTPGLLGKLMRGDTSYAEPEASFEPMSCPAGG